MEKRYTSCSEKELESRLIAIARERKNFPRSKESYKSDIECAIWYTDITDVLYDSPIDFSRENEEVVGTFTIGDFPYLEVEAGGDWEITLRYIVYLDEEGKPGTYVPSRGNSYCHEHMCAWGSCPEDSKCEKDLDDDKSYDEYWEWPKYQPDYVLMEEDIREHFGIRVQETRAEDTPPELRSTIEKVTSKLEELT